MLSAKNTPPSKGVRAKANATKGYARDNGVKLRSQTQATAKAA